MKRESQNKKILTWLKLGKPLNPIQALKRFGCFRLASRINNLRNDGNDINTARALNGNYAIYTIKK